MKPEKESFTTVVLLPNTSSKPYKFSLRLTTLKVLMGTFAVSLLVMTGIIVHYVILNGQLSELIDLRKETSFQKQKIQSFAVEIVDLKKQMVHLKEMDSRLRVITDIGPRIETTGTLGVGGAETSGLLEMDLGIRTEQLAKKVEEEVNALKAEAMSQELSLEELTQGIKDRKLVWEATPSIWPVKGWLSSGFGKRLSPFTGRLAMHKGIDIATRRNTEILSPAAGTIEYTGYDNGFGRLVKINHGHGIKTLYGHMAKDNVKIGQKVQRGDVIGFVGNTGMSTGPHLHYEVFVNGLPVNPLRYIVN